MSALPSQDVHELYTESDVEHLVARRLAAIQLKQLSDGQIELRREMLEEVADIKISIAELIKAWETAGNVVRIVKYVAAFAAACLVLVAVAKEHLTLR